LSKKAYVVIGNMLAIITQAFQTSILRMIRVGKLVLYRSVGLKQELALVIRGPFEHEFRYKRLAEVTLCFDIYKDGKLICNVPKKYLRTFRI